MKSNIDLTYKVAKEKKRLLKWSNWPMVSLQHSQTTLRKHNNLYLISQTAEAAKIQKNELQWKCGFRITEIGNLFVM